MQCPYCGEKMTRNEKMEVTDMLIVNSPKIFKSGWECCCGVIKFDDE